MMNKNDILNSSLEIALRILTLLRAVPDEQLDVDEILLLDYFVLHIHDFDSKLNSIHPSIPNRENEIFVRRQAVQQAIYLLESRQLLTTSYTSTGIRYSSNNLTISFVDYFESPYANKLKDNIAIINEKSKRALVKEIKESLFSSTNLWKNNLNDWLMEET
ncbi:hypothetical protein KQY60_000934 [Listeria monocytogenes]|nr:hypothetical protein [Listeria monocytogenes]EAE3710500.1 hypothetical protein [Listeria monocytogenes serotype 1/2b]EAC4042962.1 hypothetical protein [Listeria monocytogenes]EAC4503157.1 hypothetical protein [Listeria monocytogenes]EAC6741304.1 hypothetical protein [Listeria monocytogenes]